MPRKGPAPKRPVEVDPVYSSQLVTQLINKVLVDGKKQVAERIVHTALEGCREMTGSVGLRTRSRSRSAPLVRPPSHFVGSCSTHRPAARRPCPSV